MKETLKDLFVLRKEKTFMENFIVILMWTVMITFIVTGPREFKMVDAAQKRLDEKQWAIKEVVADNGKRVQFTLSDTLPLSGIETVVLERNGVLYHYDLRK